MRKRQPTMAARVRAVAAQCVLLACVAHARETPVFFAARASLEGGDSYLVGQEIHVRVKITNPTDGPLRFLRADPLLDSVSLSIWRGDERVQPEVDATRRAMTISEGLVLKMLPGLHLVGVFRVLAYHRRLEAGRYKAVVRVWQTCSEFGLATGETFSNELHFEVKGWTQKSLLKRDLGDRYAGLVETEGGDVLVGWRYKKQPDWTRLALVARGIEIPGLRWGAGPEKCYVEIPRDGGRVELIVVDRQEVKPQSVILAAQESECSSPIDSRGTSSSPFWAGVSLAVGFVVGFLAHCIVGQCRRPRAIDRTCS